MRVLPDAVCWHEGMQLLPQHFQLQGLRAEVLSARLVHAANPWFWGLEHLELDPSALSTGVVRILALEAILPDGLPVSLGQGDTLMFDATAAIAAAPEASISLYLALNPLARGGQVLPLKGRLQSSSGPAVPDLASGENPEPIVVWRPALRLVTEAQRADSVCLPLLRIGKDAGGFVRLPYVAPTPRIAPASMLGQALVALCAHAREKCVFLAGRLRQAQQVENTEDSQEIRRQLAALWARLPELEASLYSGTASPAQLHALLCGMAGSWSELDPLGGVPAFPTFDFNELLRTFNPVIEWLEVTLGRVRAGYRSLAFERVGNDFTLALPDLRSPVQRLVIGLRMPPGCGEEQAHEWLSHCIVASESSLAILSRQRMSGLEHLPMSRAEQIAYSVGEDTHLFVVQAEGDWFDPAQRLCLRAAAAGSAGGSPWQVVLFTVDGASGA
ncbi:type VI secretion system baseplate subunit TssK [Pseudomonas sp. PDM20]|uniref:type VI secretion system baseplate subunit TssK n=1 Tax=Pseudomonas sp. PDM20 TaxID=2769254 RepID=UPI00177B7949|nr:type VI secretion system baseplate subunit TssK [Pseudomonas sp. PDM20]MBD9684177.1 type VI secretion system baseplate subunit TssK [Pseudomonas sp. PDM20]